MQDTLGFRHDVGGHKRFPPTIRAKEVESFTLMQLM